MLTEKPWRSHAVITLFLAVIASFCCGIILATLVETLHIGHAGAQRRMLQMLLTGFSFHGMSLFWVALFLMAAHLKWRDAFGFLGSSTFLEGSFTNMAAFATKLLQGSDAVSRFLMEKLSLETKTELVMHETGNPLSESLQSLLVKDINSIIKNGPIYEDALFSGIALREGTLRLLNRNPQGDALAKLNRMLIEDAYPEEVSRNPVGWLKSMGVGMLAGLVFLPAALLSQRGCQWVMETLFRMKAEPQHLVEELLKSSTPSSHVIFIGVLAVLVAPVVEEILFRGILYPTLKRTGHPWLAAIGVSLFFGAFHMNLMSLLPLALFSMVLIFLYERTGNLLAPILAHGTFNLVNFLLLVLKDSIINWLNHFANWLNLQ